MTFRNSARLAIVILGLAAYGPAILTPFLYDDHILIESNPAVHTLSISGIQDTLTTGIFEHPRGEADFYRPLQVLSIQIEYALWHLNPLPYHVTNLIFHIGNALLVNELLIALGLDLLLAGLAASLFAVHPIIVEDLLMVSGRGELMGLFFMLLSLILCLRPSRRSQVLGWMAFFLALLSKESAAIMPALLAAAFYFRKESHRHYVRLFPLLGVLIVYLLIRHHALAALGPPLELGRTVRFLYIAFPTVLLRYARILVFPFDLHTDRLLLHVGPLWYLRTALVGLSGAWVFGKGPRWARFSFLWYVLNFLPKVPLMIAGSFMSDHWAYPALIAFVFPLAGAIVAFWNAPARASRLAARGAGVLFVIAAMLLTWFNIVTRNTDEKLYRSALHYTTSPVMQYNLGILLLRERRPDESLPYFQALYARDPQDGNLARAVAAALWDGGHHPEALSILDAYLQRFPDDKITRQMRQTLPHTF